MKSFVCKFSSKKSLEKLQRVLDADSPYDLHVIKDDLVDCSVLDTFDGEIRLSERILLQVGQTLLLINFLTGQIAKQQVISTWSFQSDLEEGVVAGCLRNISPLRAFKPVAKITMRRELGLVLDDEGKTRVRLHCFSFFKKKKSIQLGITQYLRGYGKAHTDLKNRLKEMGAVSVISVGDINSCLGIISKNYSAKPDISLASSEPIKKSATTIIRAYLNVARQNQEGIIADYDTEFLHDFRVSFRKVRSVLSLLAGVYGEKQTAELKQEFASLMKQTNRLRDLDVYLLDRREYFQLVPESSHEGLEIMFDLLLKERRKEHGKVCKIIKSRFYRERIDGWDRLFATVDSLSSGPAAGKRSDRYVAGLILRRYRKVCKVARAIDGTTTDNVVHELRIHCKKLRYLMEFSLPLFSRKKVKTLIKSLKLLQDNLGRFNDYSVQQESLGTFMSEHSLSGKKGMQVAESIGALTAMLYQLQRKERNLVMENFERFDNERIHTSFTELFHIKGSHK